MDFLFALKKILGVLVSPLPIIIVCLGLGLFFINKNKRQLGLTLNVAGFALLLITSSPLLSVHLIRSFEFSIPKLDTTGLTPEYIVVLGCWHSSDEQLPLAAKLHQCSLPRVVQSVQFWREFPSATVIYSGWSGQPGEPSHPAVNAQVAKSLGLPAQHIMLSPGSGDTEAEAKAIKQLVGTREFILIASASQMPRAMTLFNRNGLFPHPSPAEYVSGHGDFNYNLLVPQASALRQSERGVYEALGNLWIRLKTVFE